MSLYAALLVVAAISSLHDPVEAFGYKKLLKYGALAGAFGAPYAGLGFGGMGGLGGLGGFGGGLPFGGFGGYGMPYAYGYGYPGYGYGYYG